MGKGRCLRNDGVKGTSEAERVRFVARPPFGPCLDGPLPCWRGGGEAALTSAGGVGVAGRAGNIFPRISRRGKPRPGNHRRQSD